jgi:hypothetical protein
MAAPEIRIQTKAVQPAIKKILRVQQNVIRLSHAVII